MELLGSIGRGRARTFVIPVGKRLFWVDTGIVFQMFLVHHNFQIGIKRVYHTPTNAHAFFVPRRFKQIDALSKIC